uniref:Fluorescent protein n=2 Tax=Acropora digitifera TaxID=70779 RepID=A0A1S7IWX3_ACRDI|nr:fluorescent protein [Acropora digitifera]
MSYSKQGIAQVMKTKYHMEGSVNGHEFTIEGVGTGNPYEGTQMSELVITKPAGKRLPFSFDILSTVFQYGNRCFTKYPEGMTDYFKQAFPDGMSYERSFLYEDGGVATASWNIRLEGDCFIHKSIYHGVNFPADGPVMKKKTIGWDKAFEKMTVSKDVLRGDVTEFLMLEGGGYHSCQFHSTYKPEKPATLPPNHVVEHHIVRTDLGQSAKGFTVKLEEHAAAHVNPLKVQ